MEARALIFTREHRAFTARKLHSLTGLVPVGVFLVLHLWTVAHAMQGQRSFEQALAASRDKPDLLALEVLFVFLPLLYHAVYGLKITAEARPNLLRYPTSGNWGYLFQRVTGLVILAFLCLHLYEVRGQALVGRLTLSEVFPELCASLSSTAGGVPVRALVYLTALAAAVFHLSYGLYGFCFSWGITRSRRAANGASLVFGLLGLALFVLGATTILYFATGSRLTLEAPGNAPAIAPLSCQHLAPGDQVASPSPGDSPLPASPARQP